MLFVHVPSLIADCYTLGARGFAPLAHVPELFSKQLMLACALTLPSLALASLVRSFSHFVLELFTVAAVILLLSGMIWREWMPYAWEPFFTVRKQAVIVAVAVASAAILYLQYYRRRVVWSRALAGGAALGSALLYSLFLPQSALAIRAAVAPAHVSPVLRLDTAARAPWRYSGRDVTVRLPIALSGYPEGTRIQVTGVASEISAAGGPRYREQMVTTHRPFERRPYALYIESGEWTERPPAWITLQIEPPVFAGLANHAVTIRGEAAVRVVKSGGSTSMRIGETREIAGVGRCSTSIVEVRFGEEMIKLECESPRRNPYQTRARLTADGSPQEWIHSLGDARSLGYGPVVTWLSPLHRDQTFWHLAHDPQGPGSQWVVPRRLVPAARIEIIPQEVLGYAAVKYEFRDLDLRQYVVRAEMSTRSR